MSSNLPLSDDDVHAYADGKLPEARERLAERMRRSAVPGIVAGP